MTTREAPTSPTTATTEQIAMIQHEASERGTRFLNALRNHAADGSWVCRSKSKSARQAANSLPLMSQQSGVLWRLVG